MIDLFEQSNFDVTGGLVVDRNRDHTPGVGVTNVTDQQAAAERRCPLNGVTARSPVWIDKVREIKAESTWQVIAGIEQASQRTAISGVLTITVSYAAWQLVFVDIERNIGILPGWRVIVEGNVATQICRFGCRRSVFITVLDSNAIRGVDQAVSQNQLVIGG